MAVNILIILIYILISFTVLSSSNCDNLNLHVSSIVYVIINGRLHYLWGIWILSSHVHDISHPLHSLVRASALEDKIFAPLHGRVHVVSTGVWTRLNWLHSVFFFIVVSLCFLWKGYFLYISQIQDLIPVLVLMFLFQIHSK